MMEENVSAKAGENPRSNGALVIGVLSLSAILWLGFFAATPHPVALLDKSYRLIWVFVGPLSYISCWFLSSMSWDRALVGICMVLVSIFGLGAVIVFFAFPWVLLGGLGLLLIPPGMILASPCIGVVVALCHGPQRTALKGAAYVWIRWLLGAALAMLGILALPGAYDQWWAWLTDHGQIVTLVLVFLIPCVFVLLFLSFLICGVIASALPPQRTTGERLKYRLAGHVIGAVIACLGTVAVIPLIFPRGSTWADTLKAVGILLLTYAPHLVWTLPAREDSAK